MYTEIIKVILENPKLLKVCGVIGSILLLNLFIYNYGFDKGVNSVECPKIPPKTEICGPEIATNTFLSGELSKCRKKSATKVSKAVDECREQEKKACEDKMDDSLKACVELNCELCETFK